MLKNYYKNISYRRKVITKPQLKEQWRNAVHSKRKIYVNQGLVEEVTVKIMLVMIIEIITPVILLLIVVVIIIIKIIKGSIVRT